MALAIEILAVEDINGAGGDHRQGDQRNGALGHHQHHGAAPERYGAGGAEGRGIALGQKEIVKKARPPGVASRLGQVLLGKMPVGLRGMVLAP